MTPPQPLSLQVNKPRGRNPSLTVQAFYITPLAWLRERHPGWYLLQLPGHGCRVPGYRFIKGAVGQGIHGQILLRQEIEVVVHFLKILDRLHF